MIQLSRSDSVPLYKAEWEARAAVKQNRVGRAQNMASKEALKCVVFLGSVRENNMGSRAAKFITRKLTEKGFQVDLLGELAGIKLYHRMLLSPPIPTLSIIASFAPLRP